VGAEGLEPKFREIQSYLGSHWDLCFIYDFDGRKLTKLTPKSPYTDAAFYKMSTLPRQSISSDHLEVLEGLSTKQR
jgi:hypothetical protein